jgi:hypothetical protein
MTESSHAHLTERHLAAARAVLDRVIGDANIALAFVSGSLVAGLGHSLSDVDLYVHRSDDEPVPERGFREDGFIVQINPLSQSKMDVIRRICPEFVATAADRQQLQISERDLVLAVRYSIGYTLVNRLPALPDLQQSRETMKHVVMARAAYDLSGMAEDALGALQSGDTLTATFAAQLSMTYALECVLAASGDLYVGTKFLPRRCARVEPLRECLDLIWDCLRLPHLSADYATVSQAVMRNLYVATYLVGVATLHGWSETLGRIERPELAFGAGVLRSPWVVPVRFGDIWGMVGPDIGYRVTEAMVRLWLALDGRPPAELHAEFPDVPAESLDTAVSRLVESNAAALSAAAPVILKGGVS